LVVVVAFTFAHLGEKDREMIVLGAIVAAWCLVVFISRAVKQEGGLTQVCRRLATAQRAAGLRKQAPEKLLRGLSEREREIVQWLVESHPQLSAEKVVMLYRG
jgi:hypothetical protein